ncbi:MAG TPA: alpha/beta fold hydrolase [Gammaproteobacteria bacterium]|nr:alpha/beta fold hydrolase [Gammaproteobacteria bacterium]
MSVIDTQTITTGKGHKISATFYSPDEEVKAAVLIVPAIGVSQDYYACFAEWLSSQGYLAVTFDYFGTGLSLSGKLRDVDVSVTDWAQDDCVAMVDASSGSAPGKPLYWLGHSLGGQTLGLVKNRERITKAITVASGSGYWRENSPQMKNRAWLLWYFVAPIATRLFGYFPGKRLNMVGDLPEGVIKQWRGWCLHPEYLIGVEGDKVRALFSSVTTPITSLSFTDDELMSEKNIDSLHGFYTDADKTMIRISAEDIGEKRIGHFGFFNKRFKKTLWVSHLLPELGET